MIQLASGLLAIALSVGAMQNNQDVPKDSQAGPNNPDLQQQKKKSTKKSHNRSTADVPHDQPGTNNPDIGSTKTPKPRKTKKDTTTTTGAEDHVE